MNDQDIIDLLSLDEPVFTDDISLDLREDYQPPVLLRLADVLKLLTISRSTLYAMLDSASPYYEEQLPRPIQISTRSVAWYQNEIEDYIRTRPRA